MAMSSAKFEIITIILHVCDKTISFYTHIYVILQKQIFYLK